MNDKKNLNGAPENHVAVLGGQGWVGLVETMGSEVSIINAARVSFGKFIDEMEEKDIVLLKYLIENKHTSPLEHVMFSFVVHCPLFIRSQWHRHRTWSYNEISRRYTEFDMEFYVPTMVRGQSENNRQASEATISDEQQDLFRRSIRDQNLSSLKAFEDLLAQGVCREQARGVLSQNLMTTFWATVDLSNLIHFLEIRDHEGAQWEIRAYAKAIKKLIKPILPNVAKIFNW